MSGFDEMVAAVARAAVECDRALHKDELRTLIRDELRAALEECGN